jgi:glycine C-acetyltransferase
VNATLERELRAELDALAAAGTLKAFHAFDSPQAPHARLDDVGGVLVLCSNNYLSLADHPAVVAAGVAGLERYGAGTASVRFICGLFAPHRELEHDLASFLGTEAALSFGSCWAANEAAIAALTDARTVILSDALNHASIIDAIRLSRPARRVVYPHADMAALAAELAACPPDARKLVITDGVFSMEGDLAPLDELHALCRAHDAILVVDDSHGTGVMGETGRGTPEHFGLHGEIDVVTGTLGKALGGAAGGFVAASAAVCSILEQRSRPQLFSNALPPTVACSARAALGVLRDEPQRVARLREVTARFRARCRTAGLAPLDGDSAIVPIIVGETAVAMRLASALLADEGILVTGFGYPVVPEGAARIRVQLSAGLSDEDVDAAVAAIARVVGAGA